jgi:hypothetical protein
MRDGAPPFNMINFIWEEIKGISINPQKTCVIAPYLMFMIEDVTNRTFQKDGFHIPIRPTLSKKHIVPPAQVSSPPRSESSPQQQQGATESIRPARSTGQIGRGD